jgi:EAL domain-containing protein (putative c-di-GMP-specific phosphodiesterase class I)
MQGNKLSSFENDVCQLEYGKESCNRLQIPMADFDAVTQVNPLSSCAEYRGLRLRTAFQPIYSVDHQRTIGYESLIRVLDRNQQPISPVELFQSPKNESESIYLDRLCRYIHLANFHQLNDSKHWLFINVSADASAKGREYGSFFFQAMAKFNIKPENVVVEIIEDSTSDNKRLMDAAQYYKSMGCLLAIDDFGAGHSNFERVWNLQPDIVKLDRSLLIQAEASSRTFSMMTSMVNLLHQAGCLVVIEGVETEQQALIAMRSGVDFVQGYYFGKPALGQPPAIDVAPIFDDLSEKFVCAERLKQQQDQTKLHQYRHDFNEVANHLSNGLSLAEACEPMRQSTRSIRCFLVDQLGKQVGQTLAFNHYAIQNQHNNGQLRNSDGANWYRKHYFKAAIKHPNTLHVSAPYRSITGDGLCMTLSMTVLIAGKTYVLCYDVEPIEEA